MALAQVGVIALLMAWDLPLHALAILALLGGQLLMMKRFLADVRGRALWYSGFGVPLFVAGMMVSAFALRVSTGGAA
jgi:chlorophyll synthase